MTTMSWRYLLAGLGVLALAVALVVPGLAQPGMGPGSFGGPGGPGDPGMIGPGYGPNSPAGGPVQLDGAADRVKEMLQLRGYNDLVVEEVMEFTNHFYVLVKEKSTGIGAFELIVERSGFIHPESGPNMMWNTKYGHMAWFGGTMGHGIMGNGNGTGPQGGGRSGQPNAQDQPLAIERARQIAGQYLSTAFPGATPDHGTAFYGYFTFDVERDDATTGMLSVNAYTGQVWYHTWHGTFLQEKEF
jgi:hypothetical protein